MDALQQLNIAAPIADIYNKLEYDIIIAIARQLSMNPDKLINNTSEWRIQMLARMGKISRETARYIAQQTRDVPGDVEALVQETIDTVLAENGLAGNAEVAGNIAKALEMYDRQAVIDKYNQVNTVMQYKSRKAYVDGVNSVADKFEKNEITNKQEHLDVLNKNALEVTLGEKSRTEAIRDTIREMSDKGIPAFVDASGREWSPEAYINMDIRNTAKNAALMAEFECTKENGQDVILVSSHAAARPLCYPYQGKFYSLSGKAGTITDAYGKEYTYTPLSSTSYGEPAGLFGINCGHTFRGVEDGLFVNNEEYYSEKENSEEYEKIQKQRAMEREIRKNKMKRDALKAAGDDEGAREYDLRVKRDTKRMTEYCEQNDLAVRMDRTQVYGYTDPNLKQKPKEYVKVVKPNEEGSQYRKYELDTENPVTITRGKEIQAYKVTNSANSIYISNDAHVKPKKLHQIDMKISEVYDLIDMKNAENKPDIFIITGDEMGKSAVAAYNVVTNRLFITDSIAVYKKSEMPDFMSTFACGDDDRSSYVHELFHWKDAEDYRRKKGTITSENKKAYFEWADIKGKKSLDKAEEKGYNIDDLSTYGSDSYYLGKYSEAHTEHLTQKLLGR